MATHLQIYLNTVANKISDCITTSKPQSTLDDKVIYFPPKQVAPTNCTHRMHLKVSSLRKSLVMPQSKSQVNETKKQRQNRLVAEAEARSEAAGRERFAMVQQLLALAISKTLDAGGLEALQNIGYEIGQSGTAVGLQMNDHRSGFDTPSDTSGLSKGARKRLRRRQREAQLAITKTVAAKACTGSLTDNGKSQKSQISLNADMTKSLGIEQSPPNVPVLSGMLYELAVQFRTEIRLLQMLFDSELDQNSKVANKDQLIVAEITLANNSPITSEAFKFMRSVILSTLEKYQKLKKATPIFYSMTHNHTYINILCEDEYSFQCLKDSTGRMQALGSVCLYPLQPNAVRLYCYSVIYTGIINDPMKFLLQVRLHAPKMRTDHWIVASSKVCIKEKGETQFLFLVDELSALALEYQHCNRLFICLEEASFHNHGQLPNFL
ncbi:uncharacterized protein LOC129248846 [Anastrepha obliqua]|uniref:uncharacterized protein LOC129248846 n=1 Tax=Anastrepha obliqua TaxID=95512 RepID=UPI00240A7935|nr:uncharacterized protein LOC129248846 [Anastrepha obliqua]